MELKERISCEKGVCVVPDIKPLSAKILQMALEGINISSLTHPLCANCIAIKRINASLEEKVAEILQK
jgi:hypothetical protein